MKNYTQVKFTKSVQIQTDIKQNIHHKHQIQMSEVNPFDIAFLLKKKRKKKSYTYWYRRPFRLHYLYHIKKYV